VSRQTPMNRREFYSGIPQKRWWQTTAWLLIAVQALVALTIQSVHTCFHGHGKETHHHCHAACLPLPFVSSLLAEPFSCKTLEKQEEKNACPACLYLSQGQIEPLLFIGLPTTPEEGTWASPCCQNYSVRKLAGSRFARAPPLS